MAAAKHIVVVGAGVGGLGTALALARAGHRVTVLERDATPMPHDPDEAFAWDRRGAPQVRHSHALLARLRNLLRDQYPDVLERLLEAGATEIRFCDHPPPDLADREPREGDEDLVAIACRRTTFEWVLRSIVLAEAHVTVLDGVTVNGLIAAPARALAGIGAGAHHVPTITGVRVTRGGVAETIDAEVVVSAGGRRAGTAWLDELGVSPVVTEEDTGIIYLSRFYRLHDEADMPESNGPIGGDLGYLKYAVFQGDNRTYSVTFAVRKGDDELRTKLLDPDTFDHAARVLPATADWAAADIAEPITPVHVMAGLLNRHIRYLDDDGQPLVLGYHAVGDAHTCTNPLYGRGCSLAMVQATLLADALAAHPDDPAGAALAYERASSVEVQPWYDAAVAQDRYARKQAKREQDAAASPGDGADDGAIDPDATAEDLMADIMRDGLFPAVRTDPVVFRAFLRAFNLLVAPDALLSDPDVIGRVMAAYQARDERPPEPLLGPPRREMLEALAGAPA
jgi:2-polyprenyl-6-methoxyphenol hydroxylase-like FAD-dependent oxidoreductase